MKVVVDVDRATAGTSDTVVARVLLINDSAQPVTIDRRLLIGPNPAAEKPTSMAPPPVAVEPTYQGDPDGATVIRLAPGAIYGRERSFNLAAGTTRFHAYLLRSLTHALLPAGPADKDLAAALAEPATVVVK